MLVLYFELGLIRSILIIYSLHNLETFTLVIISEYLKTMVFSWTNFAKYGDPTPPNSDLTPWIPINAKNMQAQEYYWNISGPVPEMSYSKYIEDRMNLWEHVLVVSDVN